MPYHFPLLTVLGKNPLSFPLLFYFAYSFFCILPWSMLDFYSPVVLYVWYPLRLFLFLILPNPSSS